MDISKVEMVEVESSVIKRIGWEKDILVVEFNTGTYIYIGVDRKVFLEMLGSKSRGRYLRDNIIGNYTFIRIY